MKKLSKYLVSKVLFTAFFSLYLVTLAFAQDKAESYKMDEIVVTASRMEEAIDKVPARMSIITRTQIEQMSGMKIDEIIRTVSGVQTSRSGISDMRAVVGMRGLGSFEQGRTLVLMDGVPLNKTDSGDVNWNRINPDDVERIEVFKGPGSSIYGTNAMGGVINIITRKPDKKYAGSIKAEAASHDTYTGSFSVSGRAEEESGLYARLSGLYRETDGYEAASDYSRASLASSGYKVMPNWLDEWSISPKIGYAIDASNNVEMEYQHYYDKRSEGQKGDDYSDGEFRHFTTDFLKMNYKGSNNKLDWQANAFYQLEQYYKLYDRPAPRVNTDVDSDRTDYGMGVYCSMPMFSDSNIFGIGADIKEGAVDAQDIDSDGVGFIKNEGNMQFYAIYLQDEMNLLDEMLRISMGLRYDYVKTFDNDTQANSKHLFYNFLNSNEIEDQNWDAVSPRISSRYFFSSDISSYISYARGFRAPELDDLCRTGYQYVGPKIANPKLEPETIDTFEAGADWQINKVKLSASAYHSIGKDFLYYVDTGISVGSAGYWASQTYQQKQNVGEVEINGFELDLKYAVNPDLSVYANYTYTDSEITDYQKPNFSKAVDLKGKELRYNPPHSINIGTEWLNPYLNAKLDLTWCDEQYTDDINSEQYRSNDYVVADIRLWRELRKNLNISLSVQNIFDNEHTLTPNGKGIVKEQEYSLESFNAGRVLAGALTYSF